MARCQRWLIVKRLLVEILEPEAINGD